MKNIGIFGTPRSGTSWIGHIFNSHPDVALRFQPLFSYGHKGSLSEHSSREEIDDFFRDILNSRDAFATMTAESQRDYPSFQKSPHPSHVVFKETRYLNVVGNMLARGEGLKIIGIVRNPLAVLASWMQAPKEFKPEWDMLKEWRLAQSKNQGRPEEFFGFDKWKESTEDFLMFEKMYPQKFMLLRYAELNHSPQGTTRKIFRFCELDMDTQVEKFLSDSKSRHDPDPYSVFRAQANDERWQDVLPSDIVGTIRDELRNTALYEFIGNGKHA
jgi:hypothetical protein